MLIRLVTALALGLLMSGSAWGGPQQAALVGPAERPVAVFSNGADAIVLDTRRGLLRFGSMVGAELGDCGDAKSYCLRSKAFDLEFPSQCKVWAGAGPIGLPTATVTGFLYPQRIFLVPSRRRGQIAVIYSPQGGVQGLLVDFEGKIDFAAEFRRSVTASADEFLAANTHHLFRLVTFDPLFRCR